MHVPEDWMPRALSQRPGPHRVFLRQALLSACVALGGATAHAAGPDVPSAVAPGSAATPAPTPHLRNVLLQGRTGLSPAQVRPSFASLIGRPADAALLEQLRLAVAGAYDEAGQGLVAVEVLGVYEGVATVRVQPLRLRHVQVRAVEGTMAASADLDGAWPATLPALQTGSSPLLPALDRQLRLANLQPHRRWAIDFRVAGAPAPAPATALPAPAPPAPVGFGSQPGPGGAAALVAPAAATPPPQVAPLARQTAVGQIDAHVLVDGVSPWYGRVRVDNDGQDATGRERARLQLGHGDALGPGRALDLTLLTSLRKPSAQHQLALRYQHPLPAWGSLVTVEASRAVSRPGLVQTFFDVSGDSRSLNLSLRHLLPRRGALEPYVEVGLERSVYDDVVGFFGVNLGSKVGTAPLALALGATWQASGTSAFGQVRLRHDTGWGGSSNRADYGAARAGAAPRWNAVDMVAEVRRAVGTGSAFVARAQAQWSGDPLIAPQQFRVGGGSMLRGLKEGELAGDKGVALALEYWWHLPAQHRLGLLLDVASVRRHQPQPGDVGRANAASGGLGWQWQPLSALQLQASVARLLRVQHLPQRSTGDTRVHVALDWSF